MTIVKNWLQDTHSLSHHYDTLCYQRSDDHLASEKMLACHHPQNPRKGNRGTTKARLYVRGLLCCSERDPAWWGPTAPLMIPHSLASHIATISTSGSSNSNNDDVPLHPISVSSNARCTIRKGPVVMNNHQLCMANPGASVYDHGIPI